MYLTVNELIDLPGMPKTAQGCRAALKKRAKADPNLARRKKGSKAIEYHIDILPEITQVVIREKIYQSLIEQPQHTVPVIKQTIVKPRTKRTKITLMRQCPALLEHTVNGLTEKQRKIADARATLAQYVMTLCSAGMSRIAAVKKIVAGSRDATLPDHLLEAATIASARKGRRQGIGKSSLQEWVSIYMSTQNGAERLTALAPGHHKARTPEQIGWLPRFLSHWRTLNGPSLQAAYRDFAECWQQDYADQPAMLSACPSYHAVRRAMDKLPRREKARGRVSGSAARAGDLPET